MNKSLRLGTALTAIAMIGVVTGCANPGSRAKSASIFGGKVDKSNIGLATRAQAALVANDTATAVALAERAVEGSPNDAGFRGLLGNIYFAAGRFASAESAYRDSISLLPSQPTIVLKLALVQIAQGKNNEALALLEATRGALDASDHGLALALAGQPNEAILVLEPAARMANADSRARQNLALAYAFAGDWTAARVVASQDVPADQLDARIQQWMALAKPAKASDQVAALIGVIPAVDPGQPARLALKDTNARMAALVPAPQPTNEGAPEPAPVMAAVEAPQPEPQQIETAMAAPMPEFTAPVAAPQVAEAAPPITPRAAPKPRKAGFAFKRAPMTRAALKGPAKVSINTVVQLAAYDNRAYVGDGWNKMSRRHTALRDYSPVVAKFSSSQGVFYRLSVKGFSSPAEAKDLCQSLKRAGANCFVRNVAGDAPVRIASR